MSRPNQQTPEPTRPSGRVAHLERLGKEMNDLHEAAQRETTAVRSAAIVADAIVEPATAHG